MRMPVLVAAALVLSACDDLRSFDAMSDQERLAIGSAQLIRACAAASDPHELSLLQRLEIERGHDYLTYVISHVRPGELDKHIDAPALRACFEAEGWRRELWPLVLKAGTDQQVEIAVQSTATPRFYCGLDHEGHYEPDEIQRIVAACDRLGLR